MDRSVSEATESVLRRGAVAPRIALILGSGLGDLADEVEGAVSVPFADIPHFATTTVQGHHGRLVCGMLAGASVAIMQGRLHLYEGYSPRQVTFPVRVMHALGATVLIVTNAAGGLNAAFESGDLMLLTDHLSLLAMSGLNPLVGPVLDDAGTRFVDMLDPYDSALRALAQEVAADQRVKLRQGVYVQVAGPSYETRADARFLRLAGADAVGMSTVPEVIVARQLNMRVLGISAVTNTWSDSSQVSHAKVLAAAQGIKPRFRQLITGILARLA